MGRSTGMFGVIILAMIICITGPTGVGKTDASWALIELGAPMVFLDCDWFAARIPFSWKRPSDVETVYQALSVMLNYHIGQGMSRFVIPLTVEMALSFKQKRHYLDQFRLPMFLLQLGCSDEVLRRRIMQRDRLAIQKATELEAIQDQQVSCEALAAEFTVIETSCLDERATAERVWSIVLGAGAEHAAQPSVAADAPQAARR